MHPQIARTHYVVQGLPQLTVILLPQPLNVGMTDTHHHSHAQLICNFFIISINIYLSFRIFITPHFL